MATFDELRASNRAHAEDFGHGHLPMPPARQVAVITCMDARLHPETFLGLDVGDAHVIRNAGGRVSGDAIRSLVISQRFLGTKEVVVIHHTDCGMLTFSNDDLVAKIRDDLGADASGRDFLPFGDLKQSVVDDVEAVRSSELIPDDIPVTGAIYEVETGRLQEVVRT
ncbi:MAG: carbonic anhydrase [Actinobacteria bacterium]|nr:carbonic anhydrase [Actinomycetota bacterium]